MRKLWKSPWRVRPNFQQYLESFPDRSLDSFLDVDSNLVGSIKERIKMMFPADNSIIKMTEFFIGPRDLRSDRDLLETPKYKSTIYKDS